MEINLNKSNDENYINNILIIDTDSKKKYLFFLEKILDGNLGSYNFYDIKRIINSIRIEYSDDDILNPIKEIIKNRLLSAFNNLDKLTLSFYCGIWSYCINLVNEFQKNIEPFFSNLIDINNGHSIIMIFSINFFYEEIIEKHNILYIINEIDHRNIDDIMILIDSLNLIIKIKTMTNNGTEIDILQKTIKFVINSSTIINEMCFYLDQILTDYNTNDNKTKKKIVDIINILKYVENEYLFSSYQKFMQARITNFNYKNFNVELSLLDQLIHTNQKFYSLQKPINNIIQNNKIVNSLKNRYDSILLEPYILEEKLWKISSFLDIDINYPDKLKRHLKIISEYYEIYNIKGIVWNPGMGYAIFEANINSNKIIITCNILQAILLLYLNDNNKTSILKFVEDTLICAPLATIIFKSLYYSSIIKNSNNNEYTINTDYNNSNEIDIRYLLK